ncbi:MAG TPA: c-type cytochrome [Parafilimonas sp.]|nr:c-type cytochrome [Parafilimonas sp.]
MTFRNRKKLTVTLSLAACVILSIAASKPSPVKYHDGFKNLQVLPKDISKDSLDKIMDGFKVALGVHCDFCHVRNEEKKQFDFAADDKVEKNIARHMMKMTTDINANYFNFINSAKPDTISVVKCATCHRGDPHPDKFEMPQEEHHDMPPPPGQEQGKPDNKQ